MDHAHEIRVERLVPRANTSGRIGVRSISVNESGYAAWPMRCLTRPSANLTRARRLAVAERIAALHTQHGQEPASASR